MAALIRPLYFDPFHESAKLHFPSNEILVRNLLVVAHLKAPKVQSSLKRFVLGRFKINPHDFVFEPLLGKNTKTGSRRRPSYDIVESFLFCVIKETMKLRCNKRVIMGEQQQL